MHLSGFIFSSSFPLTSHCPLSLYSAFVYVAKKLSASVVLPRLVLVLVLSSKIGLSARSFDPQILCNCAVNL